MKTTRIVTIICWAVAALSLVSLAVWFLTSPVFGFRTGSGFFSFGFGNVEILSGAFDVPGTETAVPADGVSSLNISWVSGGVSVEPYDGADITFTEYAQRALRDGEHFDIKTSNGAVSVNFTESNTIGRMPAKKLVVYVPRPLCSELVSFTGETVSGSFNVSGINSDFFSVDSVSGGIKLGEIKTGALRAESTSGTITVSFAQSDNITLSSTSGSVELTDCTAKTLNCDTTSGGQKMSGAFDSVRLDSVSGTLTLENSAAISELITETTSGSQNLDGTFSDADLSSISGTIRLKSTKVPDTLTAGTTSGSITVTVPNEGEISVNHSASSGKLSSDIPVIMKSGGARFKFSTTSGSVRILALEAS